MIDAKIKEAWQHSEQLKLMFRADGHTEIILAGAYVQAEARARMAAWKWGDELAYLHEDNYIAFRRRHPDDPRHNWLLADWEALVHKELSE